ncbi:MAG: hypothetical protein R2724_30840 [Bryobacterales bacterium]
MFRTVAIRAACGAAFAVALVWAQSAGLRPAHSARLRLSVKDAQSGKLTPARVYLFKGDKPFRLSPADVQLPLRVDLFYRERLWRLGSAPKTLEVTARDQSHFVLLDGEADFYLPASDDYRIEAYRGFRSKPAVAEFTLTADEDTAVKLSLEPVVGAEGWIAADDHIHLVRQPEDDEVFLKWLAGRRSGCRELFGVAAAATRCDAVRLWRSSRGARAGVFDPLGARVAQPLLWTRARARGAGDGAAALDWARVCELARGVARAGRDLPPRARAGRAERVCAYLRSQPNSSLLMNLTHGELDFIELFQFGELHTEEWYELLNAGFRVTGLAGSDFPANIGRLIRIRARFRCWGRSVRW